MFAKHLCHVLANYKTHEKELVTTTTILPEQSHGVSSPPPVEAGPVARFEPVWIRADFFVNALSKLTKKTSQKFHSNIPKLFQSCLECDENNVRPCDRFNQN